MHLRDAGVTAQLRDDRYGTALAAILAAVLIADDDFLIDGDDLLLRADGGSDLADLATARTTSRARRRRLVGHLTTTHHRHIAKTHCYMIGRTRLGCLAVGKRRKNHRTATADATGSAIGGDTIGGDRAARSEKRQKVRDIFVPRPFEGLTDEAEWIALRELVPAATAPLTLAPDLVEEFGDRKVSLATVLPMANPAVSRPDGQVFIGLQRHVQSGDASRDLAEALLCALRTEPGRTVSVPALPGEGPRLQDVLVDGPLDITMHDGFEFWLDPGATDDPNVKASLERADASIYPTAKLAAAPAAYWCQVTGKSHVRWVLPDDEDAALDALSRISAAGELPLGPETRFAGMFRAHGRLVPVWDIPREPGPEQWEGPLADFAKRYAAALADPAPLDATARRAKQGLLGRQLTLR